MKLEASMKKNFITVLRQDLLASIEEEEGRSQDRAFALVVLQYLGFDSENGEVSDGPGDRGVNYWEVSDHAATLFQVKSRDFTQGIDTKAKAPKKGHVSDNNTKPYGQQ